MKSLLEKIKNGEILLGDGALGTLLLEKELKPGDCPEALNLSHPGILAEIAREYLAAGADLIQTNTFGASPMKLADFGLDALCEEINREAVAILKDVVQGGAYISASCGPSGKLLKPYGDMAAEILDEGYERQISALARAGADVICIETMMDLEEAKIALHAAKKTTTLPVMVTMTFQQTPRGFYTMMGNGIAEVARVLEEAGADLAGSNCGNGIEKMILIAKEFKAATRLPLIIQANAGLPDLSSGKAIYPETPELFAEKTKELIGAGVSIIGGCCGTTPAHIQAMRRTIVT